MEIIHIFKELYFKVWMFLAKFYFPDNCFNYSLKIINKYKSGVQINAFFYISLGKINLLL